MNEQALEDAMTALPEATTVENVTIRSLAEAGAVTTIITTDAGEIVVSPAMPEGWEPGDDSLGNA